MPKNSKFYELLAVQVASGLSIRDGAAIVNCSTQTAYNISATVDFKARVSAIRSEITAGTVGTLTTAAAQAASTLVELLSESYEPSIRLAAAKAILATLAPMSELGELRQRLDALEKSSAR